MISFQENQKMEFKAAKILKVEGIAGKDKLYKLVIDLGSEQRQMVSGLRQDYEKDELEGMTVVVVSNLQPATIAGVESQAMILAAKNSEGRYKVVEIDFSVQPGTKIE